MRKFYIIGIVTVIVLLAGLAVVIYLRPGAQVVQPAVLQKSVETSSVAGTMEASAPQEKLPTTEQTTQETPVLASTQEPALKDTQEKTEPTQQATQETPVLASTQEPAFNSTHINLQKIENTFMQAPYKYTFQQKVERATNKKITVAVSDGVTIGTLGNFDNSLDSAWISVPLKKDRSNKKSALINIGNFAETVNQNIVDNDMEMLNNMYNQINHAGAGEQATQGNSDGLVLQMTISSGGAGDGSAGGSGGGSVSGTATETTQTTQESDSSQDDLLTFEISQPPPVMAPVNPEDIHFLSDSLNKNGASDTWEISGMLIDTAEYAMSGVQVKATLYDGFDTVLDSQYGWVQSPVLYPAVETPFLIRVSSPPADFDHYELSIPPAG